MSIGLHLCVRCRKFVKESGRRGRVLDPPLLADNKSVGEGGEAHILRLLFVFLNGSLLCEEGVPLSVFPDVVIRVASLFDFSVGSRGLRSAVGNRYVVVQEYGWVWKLGDWQVLSFVFPRECQFVR